MLASSVPLSNDRTRRHGLPQISGYATPPPDEIGAGVGGREREREREAGM